MKKIYILLVLAVATSFGFSQEFNPYVENIINAVNQDSLIQQMRNLSGEDAVVVNGEETFIEHRVSNWGNNLAADYIFEKLQTYNVEVEKQIYGMTGINVVAKQTGTLYPDEYYIICAHYDAVDYYCADDNASGTAAVIEAARIFSELEFEYSIIYALWDEEEIGLIGSNAYATAAAANGDIIHGVINMDMISWDSDGDHVAEIHTSYDANSNELADYLVEVNSIYGLEITTDIINPGAPYSDHSSFWNNDYPAILIIEEYYGGDFNPYYHTEQDRIAILDMDYFHEMSKLCIGTVAQKSALDVNVGTGESIASGISEMRIFPNPASGYAQLNLELEKAQNARISILNTVGQEILVVHDNYLTLEKNTIELPLQSLNTGIYLVKTEVENGFSTQKLMVR
jgi:hypothetical protein